MIKYVMWLILCVFTIGLMGIILIWSSLEPRRDALLENQLQQIAQAETVDDLKPILEQIVRKQRHDYK